MQTKEQVAHNFKTELQALLDKYGAELEAKDHWRGYAECGADVRMEVTVPAVYDTKHNCVREWSEIDLGAIMFPTYRPLTAGPHGTAGWSRDEEFLKLVNDAADGEFHNGDG